MDDMRFLVWLLPVIFMLHDFEEIRMAEVWNRRYRGRVADTWKKRKPFALGYVRAWLTPTLSVGIEIEFVLFVVASVLSVAFGNYLVWTALLFGLIFHFVFLHIPLCVQFRKYVPGIVTTLLFVAPSTLLLIHVIELNGYGALQLALGFALAILFVLAMVLSLHGFMGSVSRKLDEYSCGTDADPKE